MSPAPLDALSEGLDWFLDDLDEQSKPSEAEAVSEIEAPRERGKKLATPEFLIRIFEADPYDEAVARNLCEEQAKQDRLFDVKLARLLPHRHGDPNGLSRQAILRIMGLLDELSPGPRLIMVIGHLAQHSDAHISSKATLLLGRRLRSRDWLGRQLGSTDGRVRANAIESLWGSTTALAHQLLQASLRDPNNRVVGNALYGLHLMGQAGIFRFLHRMVRDSRVPFRQTACWVMGKTGEKEYIPLLEHAMQDKEQCVRTTAECALRLLQPPEPEKVLSEIARTQELQSLAENVAALAAAAPVPTPETKLPQPAAAPVPAREPVHAPEPAPVPEQPVASPAAAPAPAAAAKPAPAAAPEPKKEEAPPEFEIRLDGKYVWGR